MQTFNDLHLPEALLKSIADSGYTTPTPIQAQAIPLAVTRNFFSVYLFE